MTVVASCGLPLAAVKHRLWYVAVPTKKCTVNRKECIEVIYQDEVVKVIDKEM